MLLKEGVPRAGRNYLFKYSANSSLRELLFNYTKENVKALLIAAISGYKQYISPFLPQTCRFHPTCSSYCREAVETYGAVKGVWLSARRIARCHPFHPGGFDPLERLDHSLKTKVR